MTATLAAAHECDAATHEDEGNIGTFATREAMDEWRRFQDEAFGREARGCDDCGTTTNRHLGTCEFFGHGEWEDTWVDREDELCDVYEQIELLVDAS